MGQQQRQEREYAKGKERKYVLAVMPEDKLKVTGYDGSRIVWGRQGAKDVDCGGLDGLHRDARRDVHGEWWTELHKAVSNIFLQG